MAKKSKQGHGPASGLPMTSPSPCPIGDDEARLRLRQKFLLQDYKEMWKETQAKKKRLMMKVKKKLELLAEIKFLGRKLKSFTQNPSQTRQFKLKLRHPDDMLSSPLPPILEEPANMREVDLLGGIREGRESKIAITPLILDINQISLAYNDDDDDDDDAKVCDAYLENGKNEVRVKDVSLVKCRDAKNRAKRVKWRNPVVSMVHHLPLR